VTSWLACGHSYDDVKAMNKRLLHKGPERMLVRTEAYWKLWARKEPIDVTPLSERVRDMFYRSQLGAADADRQRRGDHRGQRQRHHAVRRGSLFVLLAAGRGDGGVLR
jgi:hypothetical protein